jgi:magnesium chelatase family protein
MFVKVLSGGINGLETFLVEVQTDISRGIPIFNIVGLGDTAVKEAKERVKSALKNSGILIPSKRITVNLSPSDLRKSGAVYDLPIAVGILLSLGKVHLENLRDAIFMGELSLDGDIKKIRGALTIVFGLFQKGFKKFFVPLENIGELEILIKKYDIEVYTAKNLKELIEGNFKKVETSYFTSSKRNSIKIPLDFSDVIGQKQAKRVLQIASAGFHHVAMIGAPGSGKSMLAKRVPTIMPPMEEEEILEVSQIYSIAGLLENNLITTRPFRSPHYTASEVAIIGGGNTPIPGEISLAHRGVLFMDELPEFNKRVLEVLRQPLEEGEVLISRANYKVKFPAKFLWITAMNPCPCGNYNHPFKECVCTPNQIKKYLRKISSPLWDRIDLKIWIDPIEEKELLKLKGSEISSEYLRKKVLKAVAIQRERNPKGKLNGELSFREMKEILNLSSQAKEFLEKILKNLRLSARSLNKLLKISRTIADLEESSPITPSHLSEAVLYIREIQIV